MNPLSTSTTTTATLLRRTALSTARRAGPSSSSFVRYESSARRHTKKLRLHPHPSMLLKPGSPATTHIVYNPPAAAPTPLVTPRLFLPADDPRRNLPPPNAEHAAAAPVEEASRGGFQKLPPPLREPYEKSYHLGPEDLSRMRELRRENPAKWSRNALAREFNTSSIFVGMVCQATEERIEEMAKRVDKVKARWGERRTIAREERSKRRAGWGGADGL